MMSPYTAVIKDAIITAGAKGKVLFCVFPDVDFIFVKESTFFMILLSVCNITPTTHDRKIAIIPFGIPKKKTITDSNFMSPPPMVSQHAILSATDTNMSKKINIATADIKESERDFNSEDFSAQQIILIIRNKNVFAARRIITPFGIMRLFISVAAENNNNMKKITVSAIMIVFMCHLICNDLYGVSFAEKRKETIRE